MNRSQRLPFFAVLLLAIPTLAQTPPPAAPQPLPTDPAALLQLASQLNGLHDSSLKPWHILASWQTFDIEKQVTDQGTFEKWWAGDKKIKINYKSAGVDRTVYTTDTGRFVVRQSDKVPNGAVAASGFVTQPVPDARIWSAKTVKLESEHLKQGETNLTCILQESLGPGGEVITTVDPQGDRHPLATRFCFADELPALRTRTTSTDKTSLNSLVQFQGQYLAKKISYVNAMGQTTEMSVDLVEILDPVVDALFVPPSDAQPLAFPTKVAVSSGVMAGNRIGGDAPEYPPEARASHVQGTVVLQGTISTEGKITDLRVISGPALLVQSALQAVRTWRYRPYMLEGTPVAVETQMNVVYSLGR
jgi:TonB family protein